jgi:hypothetical protein
MESCYDGAFKRPRRKGWLKKLQRKRWLKECKRRMEE